MRDDSTVLLSKRGIEPHLGMLDSFGGFLDGEETAEAAIARELAEETGLSPGDYSPPAFLCTAVGHYPYQTDTLSVLSLFFWARLKEGVQLHPKDDVAEIVEVSLEDIDLSQMHNEDVKRGILHLREVSEAQNG